MNKLRRLQWKYLLYYLGCLLFHSRLTLLLLESVVVIMLIPQKILLRRNRVQIFKNVVRQIVSHAFSAANLVSICTITIGFSQLNKLFYSYCWSWKTSNVALKLTIVSFFELFLGLSIGVVLIFSLLSLTISRFFFKLKYLQLQLWSAFWYDCLFTLN